MKHDLIILSIDDDDPIVEAAMMDAPVVTRRQRERAALDLIDARQEEDVARLGISIADAIVAAGGRSGSRHLGAVRIGSYVAWSSKRGLA